MRTTCTDFLNLACMSFSVANLFCVIDYTTQDELHLPLTFKAFKEEWSRIV
jgi:hypothetical protein